jgi:hypothetical protein
MIMNDSEERLDDPLRLLFLQIKAEDEAAEALPASFREEALRRMRKAAAARRRRSEALGLLAVTMASAGIMALAVVALLKAGLLPAARWKAPEPPEGLAFYACVGGLTLLLLLADCVIRRRVMHD